MAVVKAGGAGYVQLRIETNRSDVGKRVLWPKVSVEDLANVSKHTWHVTSDGNSFNLQTQWETDGVRSSVSMGRLIMGWGELGNLGRIDYRNGNTLDCRRENLRIVSQSQVLAKRRPAGGESAYKGVVWDAHQEKWLATFRGKKIGRFRDEKDAARAFDEAATEYWGGDCYLNFPPRPRGVYMTGPRARRLAHAINACLDTEELQADPAGAQAMRDALAAVNRWVTEPQGWITSRR